MERLNKVNISDTIKKNINNVPNRLEIERENMIYNNFENSHNLENKNNYRETSQIPLNNSQNIQNQNNQNEKRDENNMNDNNSNTCNNLNNNNNNYISNITNEISRIRLTSNQPIILLNEVKDTYPIIDNKYITNYKASDSNQDQNIIIPNITDSIDLEIKQISLNIRMGFIRKVYGIVLFQLLFTFGITCLSFFDEVKSFFLKNAFILYIGIGFLTLILLTLAFKKDVSKKVPFNYILLFLFIVSMSLILLSLCSSYSTTQVLIAWSATIAMSLTIIFISFFFKTKFNLIFAFIFIIFAGLIFFGILNFFTIVILKTDSYFLFTIFSSFGAILYGFYLVFHTQMLINNKVNIDTDKYIYASLQIYLDIIMIFIYLLCSKGK